MNLARRVNKNFVNVATISSGTIIANLVTIIASIFLTRIYTPAEIGYLTLLNSISVVLANIFTLGFEFAIVIPQKREVAINIIFIAIILLFAGSILTLVILLVFSILGISISLIALPHYWILCIPATVFLVGIINIAFEWYTREEKYKDLSYTRILQSASTNIPQIILGYFILDKIGLLIGFIIGRVFSSIVYVQSFLSNTEKKTVSFSDLKKTLQDFIRYPKYVAPTMVIDKLSIEAPFFLISILFDEIYLGFFAISFRVLTIPVTFLGSAIGQVFFKYQVNSKNSENLLAPQLIKTWLILAVIGTIPMCIIMIGGSSLFKFVFGEEWGTSGEIAVLLVPMLYLNFISSPTGRSFLILGLEHYTPIFSIFRIVYIVLSFSVGYYYSSLLLAVLFLSLTRTIALIIQDIIIFIKTYQHDKALLVTYKKNYE